MTLEEKFFGGYWDYGKKQRCLNRILEKFGEQTFPGIAYVKQYLQSLFRRDVSVHTVKAAFTTVQSFLIFLQKHENPHLSLLTQEDLEAFVESQQDQGLKPSSVRSNLNQVYVFVRFLIAEGIVSSDVLACRIRIRVPDPLPRAMDPLDVKRLLSVTQSIRDRAMILLLLRTGMRIGELLQTRVNDVHLEERRILIWVGEKNRIGRVVYLSDDACEAVKAWIQRRDARKPFLFYAQGRNTMSYTRARELFFKYLERANALHKGYSLHCLRHTYATGLLNAGMRLECLQPLLGHSSLEQTRRYARLTDKTREEEYFRAMARIEGRKSHEPDRDGGEVSSVFEEAELFGTYDQELHEYTATLPGVVGETDGGGNS
jgi:integrase/recombinase XerD